MRAATAASDFRLADLRRRRVAIYLALDPGDMGAYGKLMRMFFEMTADAIMREREAGARHRVLLLIDEFATFGRLPLIEGLMAAARGYGARIMIVCQAVSQLDDLYGVAGRNALLANATRHLFMASPDPATSAYVSNRIGDATIATRTRSRSSGSGVAGERVSTTTAQAARRLLKPEEFERLGAGRAVLLAPGAPPFRVALKPWFSVRAFSRRRTPPPDMPALEPSPPPLPFRTQGPVHASGARKARRRAKASRTAQGDMFKVDLRGGGTSAMTAAAEMGSHEASPAETSSLDAASDAPPDEADRVAQLLRDIGDAGLDPSAE